MKVQRYEEIFHWGEYDGMIQDSDGYWCRSADVAELEASHAELLAAAKVAELEASHAELLAAAKSVLAWYDFYSPNYYNELHEQLRAAIAKAEGEGV